MKSAIIILLAVAVMFMGGCGAIMESVVKDAEKVDPAVAALMKSDTTALSDNCRAGLAEGITAGATVSPDIKATIEVMKSAATDLNGPEYLHCKSWAAWTAFKIRGGKAKADEVIPAFISGLTKLGIKGLPVF